MFGRLPCNSPKFYGQTDILKGQFPFTTNAAYDSHLYQLMNHRSTRDVVEDLRKHGKLIEISEPLSPHLELAEIQRRVYQRGGPALLFPT